MISFARLFAFFTSPMGLLVAGMAAFGGYVLYQRNDAVLDERAKVETRKTNDINKGKKARIRIDRDCTRDASKCVPNDFYRD